ncbi:MAG: mechanosensitive ion channel, partial [Actinomyces sp.]|nr:mechanosensitive ion channel [Actinomyces sp.]
MTLTPALGALTQISTQTSGALARAAADSQSGAEAAVDTTIDLTLLFLGPIIGAVLGLVASVVLSVLARKALAKSAMASSVLGRVRGPAHFALATWGAWVGLGIALVDPRLTDWGGSSVTTFLMHLLLIAGLACMTWMGYAAAWVFEDAAKARQAADRGRSRRFETRAQVLRRLVQVIVLLVGTVAMIGTFDAARQVMTTVLASAGVISVIFGLAAQQTLGNVFAGLQLAFTDAIRMGDVVIASDKQETGSVEEITLSYVVVRIWDERRLIIPCRYFTQTPFENWTRRAAAQLGTVELKLDWSAPMTLIRAKVEKLLAATDLWDGRTWAVQITDSDAQTITVRVLVSATNSGNLNDLRAYLREHLIAWIVAEEPWARPVQHIEPRATVTVEKDMSRERIARLAAELAGISGTNEAVAATGASSSHTGGAQRSSQDSALGGAASSVRAEGAVREQPKDAAHAARMVAARRKAKRIRRRAMADRQREMAEGQGPAPDETQVISKSALRKIIEAASNRNPQVTETLTTTSVGRGERLFSGSVEADERAAALSGPGEEVFAEREANSRRVQDRREARERRYAAESKAMDDEATTALAAVGVEPVEASEASMPPAPEAEAPASAATAKSGPDKPTSTSDEATKKAQNQSSSADSAAKPTEVAGEESHSAETVDPAEAEAPAEATQAAPEAVEAESSTTEKAAPEASEQSVSETAETPADSGQAEADQAKDDQGKETEAQSEAPAATDEA